jgi:hypothetical protein
MSSVWQTGQNRTLGGGARRWRLEVLQDHYLRVQNVDGLGLEPCFVDYHSVLHQSYQQNASRIVWEA